MMVKFKRWKLVGFLLFLLILFDTDFCCGRRTRQTESMLEDFDIESSLPRFAQPIPNVTVTIGKDALLPCVVDNLRSYKVAWVRVDTQTILTIHQAVITRNPRITLSYSDHRSWFLQIKNTHESDRGWYMCQINTDPMRSLMGYLEVVVPPQIIDQDTSIDLVAKEGSNVTLYCKAKGHPEPYVMWRREDNKEIQYNGNPVNVIDGEVFPIVKISRLHMGAYLCIASNGIPPSISKRVEVKVQFPPMMTIPHQLEGAYLGQDVTLECQTEAHPKSINYWTTEKGDMIVSGDKYESLLVDISYQMYMQLKIRNLTRADFGTFKCVAKNSLGETDGNIKLYVMHGLWSGETFKSLGSQKIPAPSTTTTTTMKTTPLPNKKPRKKVNKVNEVIVETGYDEWSNDKGQPSYEDLQNNGMSSSSGVMSSSQHRWFLAPILLLEYGWDSLWKKVENKMFHQSSRSDNGPVSFPAPSPQHIASRCRSHSSVYHDDKQVEKSPMSSYILYTLGFHECGINLMCLSLTLILIHFH